ncbi:MAG TPA: plastocyanin/azurin family copper-binding protein [Thermoplasmata archaeon]|jgi:plastocyanin|nr:plastocyanin/azurin family copper-binding protein [Thermoplasmata archaeon]
MMVRRRSRGIVALVGPILVLILAALAPGAVAVSVHPAASPTTFVDPAAESVTVNITATEDLSFVPDSFTVLPGEIVHLVVTQAADFEHTFTLASLANFTLPSSDTPSEVAAFFNAQAPIVNLSLGSTAGSQHTVTFTAPSTPGSYEFVCLVHFPEMTGEMIDSTSTPAGASGGGVSTVEVVAIGVAIAAVVIAAVVVIVRRGHRVS